MVGRQHEPGATGAAAAGMAMTAINLTAGRDIPQARMARANDVIE
jgi:hypothetical protein